MSSAAILCLFETKRLCYLWKATLEYIPPFPVVWLTLPSQYSPVHDHGAPTAGLRRKAKKQFAPPPDDCAELAEARPMIKSFYLITQDATSKLEKLSKLRVGSRSSLQKHTLLTGALSSFTC
jgi:hypothetical protein